MTRPSSLVLMIGPPRSGATQIANAVMAHSRVAGLPDPWQRRRDQGYDTTDPAQLMGEAGLVPSPDQPHLVVKETTTRMANVDLSLAMLTKAHRQGIYPALILILRCPFAAFLSQVEAAPQIQRDIPPADLTERFERWAKAQSRALKKITDQARAQHLRLISHEAFCARPAPETARLMALIPERFEPDQMQGLPDAAALSGPIKVTDRSAAIGELVDTIPPGPALHFGRALHDIAVHHTCSEPDQVTLDRLSRLLA